MFFRKDIKMIKLLVNEQGDLCDLHHRSIEDGKIYTTLIVAERNNSHYEKLIKAIGKHSAANTRNLAELFDKGHRIIREY